MNRQPFSLPGVKMAANLVNLDSLIPREDFEVAGERETAFARNTTLAITELEPTKWLYQSLKKPDFQRETANWTPEKVADLIQNFLDGDLIPAIIMWQSSVSSNIFVIDGAHRLSALIAWVHDDYGDGPLSRKFYDNYIPPEQEEAAGKARALVAKQIGSYVQLHAALLNPSNSPPEQVRRARNVAALAVQLQWVPGDAKRAEDSFFKINQQATPIDRTELVMIKSRKKPNAVAARAILRAGVGHKYWSAFPEATRLEIEKLSREIYDTLFKPWLEKSITTLDLPVAGRGYSSQSVRMVFEFVNLAGDLSTVAQMNDVADDEDGSQTLAYLQMAQKLTSRISGNGAASLGLHPAVYFFGATGTYQPPAFLATVQFVKELSGEKDGFRKFTQIRDRFEEFLLTYRHFTNAIIGERGTGSRSLDALLDMYRQIMNGLIDSKTDMQIIADMQKEKQFHCLRVQTEEDRAAGKNFTRSTKNSAYIRDALKSAMRCPICKARLHTNSIQTDHKVRKADGGKGSVENAQPTHPYCNAVIKH